MNWRNRIERRWVYEWNRATKGKDKIDYNLRAFPIGGFVAMAGEVYEDDNKIKKEKLMCNKPWLQRLIILVAGVVSNFILAIVVLFISALIWVERLISLQQYFRLKKKNHHLIKFLIL